MSGLSKHLALALFNNSLNPVRTAYEPPVGLWLALHTAAPSDATYGNEASFASYARQALNSLTATPQTETAGGDLDILASNGSAVIFPASTGAVGQTITHWAIWDSQAAGTGNVLYSGSLGAARTVNSGDSVVVGQGQLTLTIK